MVEVDANAQIVAAGTDENKLQSAALAGLSLNDFFQLQTAVTNPKDSRRVTLCGDQQGRFSRRARSIRSRSSTTAACSRQGRAASSSTQASPCCLAT